METVSRLIRIPKNALGMMLALLLSEHCHRVVVQRQTNRFAFRSVGMNPHPCGGRDRLPVHHNPATLARGKLVSSAKRAGQIDKTERLA